MLDKADNRLDLPMDTPRAKPAPARRAFVRPVVQIALMALVLADHKMLHRAQVA